MVTAIPLRRIRPLSSHLANQIAAGEVVERPASVVKELVENSLDAGARSIRVEVEQGGVRLIRVQDDGHGIHGEDLPLAISSHATSKIAEPGDLERIASLGFRGEALASIAAVSRLTLTTRIADEATGWRLVSEGGHYREVEPSSHRQGTLIDVRDLFFNTPARRKFLRTERTEFIHLEDMLRRLALSRFEVDMVLTHNGRQIFRAPAAEAHTAGDERRIAALLGRRFSKEARRVDFAAAGMRLWGWVADGEFARSQADMQFVFLNGRSIRDKLVNHALRQGYRELLEKGRHPAFVLYLEVDPAQVDVNVHPTKHEVRFRESRMVHDFLVRALAPPLVERSTAPAVAAAPSGEVSAAVPKMALRAPPSHSSALRVAEQVAAYGALHLPQHASGRRGGPLGRAIAQLKGRFLLAENEEGLVLVDLRAARAYLIERQLRQEWSGGALLSQPLLMPVVVQTEPALTAIAESGNERLAQLGFEVDVLGAESVVVRQVPATLRQSDVAALLAPLLQALSRQAATGELLRLVAEHAAVGQVRMGQSEMDRLLRELESGEVLQSAPRCWRQLSEPELLALLQRAAATDAQGAEESS